MLTFGALGYLMVRYQWPRAPLVLGLVLGDVAERYLWISVAHYGAAWLGRSVVVVLMALLAAWALAETASWPIKTALYPRVVGVPLLALAVTEAVLCLRRQDDTDPREAMDVELSRDVPPAVALRRTLIIAAWMGGFFVAIVLVGFLRAVLNLPFADGCLWGALVR